MSKSLFRRLTKSFFIVTNIIVALFFMAGCYSKWLNADRWWVFGFLNVAAFYFFALLVLFILFWLFVKPRWIIISVVTIAISWQFVTNIIPFRLPVSFSKQKEKGAIRIMSWNVAQFDVLNFKKTHKVFYQMTDLINENMPDIACFQEVVCSDSTGKSFLQLDTILGRLGFPYHHYAYDNTENWFGLNMHFGTLILSRYPIIKKKLISHNPYNYNSTFQYSDIVKGNDTFRIFNIHLQSLRFSKENFRYIDESLQEQAKNIEKSRTIISKMKNGFINRKKQADWIREEMDKSPYPMIVCGDFNDVPNSYAYETIGKNLQNAFVEKGSGIGRTFSGIAPNLRIDNIFVDEKFDVLQFTRIARKLSDHFPIIADIAVEKE
ncbi:endonuclease/exonuclease/phosphatase family protein [Ferruginibacter lapsinanis]|uniref:endonuclease/exonuclease/phosphatase family protein n=1 Tax=Ferruginibacter lapsinanis TaxID=563172 RepID=UPI001E4D02F5|nr:endonuclease/exonuclease/phosphatase family protein [Ferruginibacter lapsinanis]UEG50835.1 endonuclease/exonuclease/phosphatase family protein [Ferruginibacter lapsinanis]